MRIINRVLTLGVVILLAIPVPTWGDTDEFIWQDRWQNMGLIFRDGYVLGISDSTHAIFALLLDKKAPNGLRLAHICLRSMTQIKQVTGFVSQAVGQQTDPQEGVAPITIAALVTCGLSRTEPGKPITPIDPADLDLGAEFVWKDRWESGPLAVDDFRDGYAAGIADIIRQLDNAGKTPVVLLVDVLTASNCTGAKGGIHNVGALMNTVTPVIDSHKQDPLASISGTVFDALLACGRKHR